MTRPSSNTENSGAGCTAKKKPKRATWEKRDARVKEKDTRHRRRVETPHAAAYLLTCWHVTAINSHVSMKYITEQERPCQVLCGAISGKCIFVCYLISRTSSYENSIKISAQPSPFNPCLLTEKHLCSQIEASRA